MKKAIALSLLIWVLTYGKILIQQFIDFMIEKKFSAEKKTSV